MARGWGRSEEDLEGDKDESRAARSSPSGRGNRLPDPDRLARRRGLEMDLARIEEQLGRTTSEARRRALEAARAEIRDRLARE